MKVLNLSATIRQLDQNGYISLADELNDQLNWYQEKKIDLGELIKRVAAILDIERNFELRGI